MFLPIWKAKRWCKDAYPVMSQVLVAYGYHVFLMAISSGEYQTKISMPINPGTNMMFKIIDKNRGSGMLLFKASLLDAELSKPDQLALSNGKSTKGDNETTS